MVLRTGAAAVAMLVAVATTGPAAACHGGRECYEKVRTPDVYQTVERSVVVRPGHREVVREPAVTVIRADRVEVARARVFERHVPAVYGSVMRREMVAPASVTYVATPPIVRTVHETVVVSPGGYRWEHTRGWRGQERKCKVRVAPVTRTVARQVVVSRGSRVPVVQPAVYRDVARPVVLREASTRRVYEPAQHAFVNRTVVLRPASVHVVEHPPVIGVQRHQVLVRRGGAAWHAVR